EAARPARRRGGLPDPRREAAIELVLSGHVTTVDLVVAPPEGAARHARLPAGHARAFALRARACVAADEQVREPAGQTDDTGEFVATDDPRRSADDAAKSTRRRGQRFVALARRGVLVAARVLALLRVVGRSGAATADRWNQHRHHPEKQSDQNTFS